MTHLALIFPFSPTGDEAFRFHYGDGDEEEEGENGDEVTAHGCFHDTHSLPCYQHRFDIRVDYDSVYNVLFCQHF